MEDGDDCDEEDGKEEGDWEFVDEGVGGDSDAGSVLNRKPVDMPIRDETGE